MSKRLLIVGTNTSHTRSYIGLVRDFFDDVLFITDKAYDGCRSVEVDFSMKKPVNWYRTPMQIEKVARSFSPDIIHIHQANAVAWYTLRGLRKYTVPKILTAWGSDILVAPRQSRILKRMVRYNLMQADYCTSDSVHMGEEMQRLAPGKKLDLLIANFGINIEPVETEKQKLIYSNRLHQKLYRIDAIIIAFHKFLQTEKGKGWKLVVAADGEERPALENLVKELGISGSVEMAGWVNKEKNAGYYGAAPVFVTVPSSDATAISLLEAMASKCIPIVSDLPANHEWITHGVNGIIVKDLQSDFISPVFELDWEKAIALNLAKIKEHGTKEANRKKFIALYQKALSA